MGRGTLDRMKSKLICGAPAAIAAALLAAPAIAATSIPLNTPTTVNGIDTACTGIGDEPQRDARWSAYPLKVVLAGKDGQWLADADITISQGGKDLVSVHCGGPWLLVKVPAGHYRITGVLDGQNAETNAFAPASGQDRAILRFPGTGGATSVEHKETQ